MGDSSQRLHNLLTENRVFPPSEEFAAQANAGAELYDQADADRKAFWAQQAHRLHWDTDFNQVLDWSNAPFAEWFTGGKLNVAYNCVDRHVEDGHGDQVAFHWEGERGDTRTITYGVLQREVCKAANALLSLGLEAGDRVAIQLPMIPEAVFAMLACARLGMPHSVVFGGFSAESLRQRINDAKAKLVITADGQFRRGKAAPLKANAEEALQGTSTVQHVLVVKRTDIDIDWTDGRDLWWHEVVDQQSDQHTAQPFDSEHPLFILYTSGTTGSPKGILHTSGGFLTQAAYTHDVVFD
ncbi:MAG TPA: AMP-binding protein, partial [Pseudonocardiaceae bacterium]|nr:AMP-binding protein [Pseudonocardiaceae bacterium]